MCRISRCGGQFHAGGETDDVAVGAGAVGQRQLAAMCAHHRAGDGEAEAALAIAAPKAEWVDRFVDSDGLYGLQNAGRALGVKPNLFVLALRDADILTTQGRATIARSSAGVG